MMVVYVSCFYCGAEIRQESKEVWCMGNGDFCHIHCDRCDLDFWIEEKVWDEINKEFSK